MSDVVDNSEEHRFELRAGGHLAELVYRLDGERIVLVHTGVPDELEGQGVGSRLVAASVARARDEGLTIVPRCPFARGWLERHPDDTAGVTIDWGARPPQ